MSKRHNILPTRTNFIISNAGKIESVQEFKIKFSSSCFTGWQPLLHIVVFKKHEIFEMLSIYIKKNAMEVPQIWFDLFKCSK